MVNILAFTAHNHAKGKNNYALDKMGQDEASRHQIDVQSDDVVGQGDKGTGGKRGVYLYFVEQQRECRAEDGGEDDDDKQRNGNRDGHRQGTHAERKGQAEDDGGTDGRVDERAAQVLQQVCPAVFGAEGVGSQSFDYDCRRWLGATLGQKIAQ